MSEKNVSNESFSYTYSAKQQEEIQRIKQKYMGEEKNKLNQLRRLDSNIEKKGMFLSVIVGVIGLLLLGTGMSLILVWATSMFVPGIILGVLGMGIIVSAYPLNISIIKKERAQNASQIIKLAEELEKNRN